MLLDILLPAAEPVKSTLPGIIIGAALGIALTGLLGWGVAALLGRRFAIRLGIVLIAGLVGLIGAVIGDAKAARKRPLDEKEALAARRVFGESLDHSKIRLALNCRLMTWPRRKMWRAPGNTIFVSKKYSVPQDSASVLDYEDILVHELTHVWQTQNGVPFRKKLGTALRVIFNRKKPYNYGQYPGLKKAWEQGKCFRDFNTEQQGDIMRKYHCLKYHIESLEGSSTEKVYEYFARQVRLNKGYFMVSDTVNNPGKKQ